VRSVAGRVASSAKATLGSFPPEFRCTTSQAWSVVVAVWPGWSGAQYDRVAEVKSLSGSLCKGRSVHLLID
jgi:hypothetical protein